MCQHPPLAGNVNRKRRERQHQFCGIHPPLPSQRSGEFRLYVPRTSPTNLAVDKGNRPVYNHVNFYGGSQRPHG